MVDKLMPVVCLNSFDRKLELVLSVSKEADCTSDLHLSGNNQQ
jgi:hypothetical protein